MNQSIEPVNLNPRIFIQMKKPILLSIALMSTSLSQAQLEPAMAPFHHGVASGDALADRVIIWTRVTPGSVNDSFEVDWQVATDQGFSNVVANGSLLTDASVDFTVKVDVTGLSSNSWYYYRFSLDGAQSLIGRTRTAPNTQVEKLRFAVVSCQNFGGGLYFNAYTHLAEREDIDAVIHLGDYMYEGGGSPSGNGIEVLPAHQTVTLEDYRQRYASYRLDANLREVHRKWPFYNVWDDHETANNSWRDGAQNHNPATQGPWEDRKAAGQQAYFEWIPIRTVAAGSYSIYRTIPMGPLVDLIMIDTRLEGRDEEVGTTSPEIDNPNRTILGAPQKQWFKDQLSTSTAQWKIVGNQVMFAPLMLPAVPIILPNGSIVNADQWDGYRPERTEIINHLHNNSINNVVVLTGDIHTSWGNDIPRPGVTYNPSTGAGSVAVEFVTTSITSGSSPVSVGASIISGANPHIKYVDLSQKGYLLLDVDQQRVKGSWVYVSSVTDAEFTTSETDALVAISGQNYLRPESALSLADLSPQPATLTLNVYPNPTADILNLSVGTTITSTLGHELIDVTGKRISTVSMGHLNAGEYRMEMDVSGLAPGLYLVRVFNGQQETAGKLFVKE